MPALESLETVNVVTNSFDAEQGLAGGSAINVQIKSGTNQFKGSAFEYYTNEQMRANNYFTPAGTSKGKWRYHQFGGKSADRFSATSCSSSEATRTPATTSSRRGRYASGGIIVRVANWWSRVFS